MGIPISGLAVASELAGAAGDIFAGQQLAAKYRTEAQEAKLKGLSESVLRQQKLRTIIGADIAQGAARGITVDSGSLQAIEINNFNEFAQDEELGKLESDIEQQTAKSQARQAEATGFFSASGDLFGIGAFLAEGKDIPGITSRKFDIFGRANIPSYSRFYKFTKL